MKLPLSLLLLMPLQVLSAACCNPENPCATQARPPLVPETIAPAIPDLQAFQHPGNVQLDGWVGHRLRASEKARLIQVDLRRLLEGFLKRPGCQEWDGEHIGKWFHAASYSLANSGNPAMRQKLDEALTLMATCQLEDGYLGTYTDDKRWSEWDVWVHKYNLLGLIACHRVTGDPRALQMSRRMADLLCREFGDGPGQRDIMKAGHFSGMAPMSVLEPMAQLYRLTGEPRYLDFCQYIVRASESETGPRLISTLLRTGRVADAPSTKAYEMLSCFNGFLEMYRSSGQRDLLEASLRMWEDVRAKRLYPTGAASYRELFREDGDSPNSDDIGETCVAVTWFQINLQLLRFTGQARFAAEAERVLLNHLLGAQRSDGTAWCYFTPLQFLKSHTAAPEVSCCFSSGPRSLAITSSVAITTDAQGVVVNFLEKAQAKLHLASGEAIEVSLHSQYPSSGDLRVALALPTPATFALRVRLPEWATGATVTLDGNTQPATADSDGYLAITRQWKGGDELTLNLPMQPRIVRGTAHNSDSCMIHYGPMVLSADEALLPDSGTNAWQVALLDDSLKTLAFTPEPAPTSHRSWPGALAFRIQAGIRCTSGTTTTIVPQSILLVPFGEAAGYGTSYRTWFPIGSAFDTRNLLAESRITATADTEDLRKCVDGEITTSGVMRAAPVPGEHGFDITLPRPVTIQRLTYAHGTAWGPGGWFDSSAGAPRFEIQRTPGGPWENVGTFPGYPATTAKDGAEIAKRMAKNIWITTTQMADLNREFTYTLVLPEPVSIVAVRVRGQPSMPDTPGRGELKCAEIQAFAK